MVTMHVRLILGLGLLVGPVLPGWLLAQGAGHGPFIKITANGEPFFEGVLRDSETVSREQLGAYLSRLTFKGTAKTPIKAEDADASRATLQAKFEIYVARRGEESRPVFTMMFDEMRLSKSKTDNEWFLTREGIALIKKAGSEKQ